jgi:hypothetical protein
MAELLTLSLTETTRGKNDYQVIARDQSRDRWVMLDVPRDEFKSGSEIRWDLFAVTEGEIRTRPGSERPEEHILIRDPTPRLIDRYATPDQKLQVVTNLAVKSINDDIYAEPDKYVGIVRPDQILDISMSIKELERQRRDFDPERRFFWNARIRFINDETTWDIPCKDMRWKQYWLDVKQRREEEYEDLKRKWISYMSVHHTYFLIEIYPLWKRQNYCAISGMYCFFDDHSGMKAGRRV